MFAGCNNVYSTVPAEIVAQFLRDHPSTRDELRAIRDPRDPTRYSLVYLNTHGGNRQRPTTYRARILKFLEIGSGFASAEEAARAVVAFHKGVYGEQWQRAFANRKVAPWRLRTVRRRSLIDGRPVVVGYGAEIYVRGRPVGVTRASAGQRGGGEWVWATAGEAKEAARAAMARRFHAERETLPVAAPGLLFWRG